MTSHAAPECPEHTYTGAWATRKNQLKAARAYLMTANCRTVSWGNSDRMQILQSY